MNSNHRAQLEIPFRLRVGVVGHRELSADMDLALRRRVREKLDELIGELDAKRGSTPILLRAVSPLAEGADRLVASEVLEYERADLEAILPFTAIRYREDFKSAESKKEFDDLRKGAVRVTQLTHECDSGESYERAGQYVVDHSDVVFLVWDGQPARGRGGTACILEYVRDKEKELPRPVPYFILDSTRTDDSGDSFYPNGWSSVVDSYKQCNHFNTARVWASRYKRNLDAASQQGVPNAGEDERDRSKEVMDELFSWSIPLFVRSDLLANRMRHLTNLSFATMTVLSLLAAVVATLRALVLSSWGWLTWLEVALLSGAACVFGFSRMGHFNQRWIDYRALTENLRAAPWLAATHPRASHVPQGEVLMWHSPDHSIPSLATWQERLFDEVWTHRPHPDVSADDLPWLKVAVSNVWVGGQIQYHGRSSVIHQQRHLITRRGIEVFFLFTIGATLVHALGVSGKTLEVLIIVLPAGAASIAGFAATYEYHRHAERYSKTMGLLERAKKRIENARDMRSLRTSVDSAYECVVRENDEWFDSMRFHEPVISG